MRKLLLVLLAAFAAATAYLFIWPETDSPPRGADAVVVLSGGRGHRLAEGRRLIAKGISKTLAISDGSDPDWPEASRLCRSGRAICFTPDPYSTQGEARWIAQEARERGWDSIVVVTSTYHVRRTRLVVERCFAGDLAVVGARPPVDNQIVGVAWEWPKSVYYLTLNRGC